MANPWNKGLTKKTDKRVMRMYENRMDARYWLGKKRSEETKKKMSEARIGRIPWNIGKPRSEETKRKISIGLKSRLSDNERKTRKEKRKLYLIEYRKKNRGRINELVRINRRTPNGNLNHRMEVAILLAIKGEKAGRKWEGLVGYTLEELKKHIESLFTDNMNWDEFTKGQIHIDHKKPKSLFSYKTTNNKEFKMCWGLDNLQPLWAADNRKKGKKYRSYISV